MTKTQTFYSFAFVLLLSLMPLIAVDMPRFLAVGPGVIGIIFLALYKPVFKTRPALTGEPFILVAQIMILAFLSTLWSIAPDVSTARLEKLALVLIPGAVLITLTLTLDIEKLRTFLWLFPAGVGLAALLLSVEMLFDGPVYRLTRSLVTEDRVRDHVFNRGAVAVVLCYFPASFMARYTPRPKLTRTLLTLAIVGLVFTNDSQSALLALFLGLVVLVLFPYKKTWAWKGLGALIIALIFASPFLSIWMFASLAEPLNELPFVGKGAGAAGARMEIWDYVARYTLEHNPWYGLGIEATKTITDFEMDKIYQPTNLTLHPHNFALQLWIEMGVIGALAGSTFCTYMLWTIKTKMPPAHACLCLATFVAALCIAAIGYGMWQSWWIGLLFMVTALCIIAGRLEKRTHD